MTGPWYNACGILAFLLTCLLRGMTSFSQYKTSVTIRFYSHASCEAWQRTRRSCTGRFRFYSHASCEAWRFTCSYFLWYNSFYSHASCEAWRTWVCNSWGRNSFYSHASCEAWRLFQFAIKFIVIVSTHMPLARHDWTGSLPLHDYCMFLLTCLLRGMTAAAILSMTSLEFLLTCLLRGMTYQPIATRNHNHVSTHMPLARHDWYRQSYGCFRRVSTHMPLARHDFWLHVNKSNINVSTHMPLARHDIFCCVDATV